MVKGYKRLGLIMLIIAAVILCLSFYRKSIKRKEFLEQVEVSLLNLHSNQSDFIASLFIKVKNDTTKQNCDILADKLYSFVTNVDIIIGLNKDSLNKDILKRYDQSIYNLADIEFIKNMTSSKADIEKLNKIEAEWNQFTKNIHNDVGLNGVSNINSLTMSYLDHVNIINALFEKK